MPGKKNIHKKRNQRLVKVVLVSIKKLHTVKVSKCKVSKL